MTQGLFITLEGPEGAGKTTQLQLLKEYFESLGKECVITREPGGTQVAEQLREIVKHHTGPEKIVDEAEVLLFAASRAQHVRNLIIPALDEGKVILCDRFYDSTLAYQGYARGQNMDFLKNLTTYAICGCVPDITFLLDLTPEASFQRTKSRGCEKEDRIEAEGLKFHNKVRTGFLELAKTEPERIKTIDASLSMEEVHKQIISYLK